MNDPFPKRVEKILKSLKTGKKIDVPSKLHGILPNGKKIKMSVITEDMLKNNKTIKLLAAWRDKSNRWFPAQFKVTLDGTKKWATEQLLKKKDRILFFLQLIGDNKPFGHVGLYRFDYKEKSCEIDNIIRGEEREKTRGGMTIGLRMLINWTFFYLGVQKLYLKVFSDNARAISLYTRLGFKEVDRTPLMKKVENNVASWVEVNANENKKNFKRYFVKMCLRKNKAHYA